MPTENQHLEEVLFDLALQKANDEERADFLDRVCQGNPTLRASLEELLKSHYGATGFLAKPSSTRDPASPAPAQTIGRYKLLEKLGEGGFGEVWMAEQREPIKRRVALKIIKLGMDSRQVVARFEAERQALAMMDHPNIAKVFDAETTENGRPYFVMELVRGIKITDYCDQNQLSTQERLQLFVSVCQAIQHAHQKGIIHRDIKPSNVLVTLHDGVPVPKVIDFGIAKATQQELTDKTLFTRFQQFVGTPAYVSPEQAEMSGLDVDTRSDIYSLGVLLYELLLGCTPLDSQELTQGGLDAIRKAIREKEPLRPSSRLKTMPDADRTSTARRCRLDPPSLAQQLRGDLDWIVMKALEKDRTRRYETANDFVRDIRCYLTHEPVSARQPNVAYKMVKAWRRHKLGLTSLAAVALALIAGFTVSTFQAIRATKAEQSEKTQKLIAEMRQQTAEEAQRRAEESEKKTSELHYVASLNLAQTSFETLNFRRTKQVLEETRDHPNRGFEWYYWQNRMHGEERALWGHSQEVLRVDYSPDGRWIVSGDKDGLVILWDAVTGEQKQRYVIRDLYPTDAVLAFGSDSRKLLVNTGKAYTGESLHLFDVSTGTPLWRVIGRGGGAFSPDGREIAVVHGDEIEILDARTGERLRSFPKCSAHSLSYTTDGFLVVRKGDTTNLHDAGTGQFIRTVNQRDNAYEVTESLSHDGSLVATATWYSERLTLADGTGTGRPTTEVVRDHVRAFEFSRDDQWLLAARSDRTARIWKTDSFDETHRFDGHAGPLNDVALSPDDHRFASASADGTVRLWKVAPPRHELTKPFPDSVEAGPSAVDKAGRLVATAHLAGVTVWDAGNGETVRVVDLFSPSEASDSAAKRSHPTAFKRINSVAFSPNGDRVLLTGWNHEANVIEIASGKIVQTLRHEEDPIVWSASYSTDGSTIVTSGNDGSVRIWDADTGRQRRMLRNPQPGGVDNAVFSPDGRRIAAVVENESLHIWDAETGDLIQSVPGGVSELDPVLAFSPDGKLLASSTENHTTTIWDAESFESQTVLTGHSDHIRDLTFSPDGTRLLTGSDDGTARLWDSRSGHELLNMKEHDSRAVFVRFFPDGQRILTGTSDHVRISSAATPEQAGSWKEQEREGLKRAEENQKWWQNQKAEIAAAAERTSRLRAADPGAVKQWLLLPPIPVGNGALDTEIIASEASLRPNEGDRVVDLPGQPVWIASRREDYEIRWPEPSPGSDGWNVSYAVSYLGSETARSNLTLKVGSRGLCKVYLNGDEVYRYGSGRFWRGDQDEATGVELRAGLNVIVFKWIGSSHDRRDPEGSLWITDAEGQPVSGLRSTLDPDAGR